MGDQSALTATHQPLMKSLGHGYRTVVSSGAPDRHGQGRLSLVTSQGKDVGDQGVDVIEDLVGGVGLEDVARDRRI
jgi:hypothetical protein